MVFERRPLALLQVPLNSTARPFQISLWKSCSMVLLLTDVFLLLTQVLLWIVVGLITWYVVLKALPRVLLGKMVLGLILVILGLAFIRGPIVDGGVLPVLWRIISFPLTPWGLGLILLYFLITGKLKGWVKNLALAGVIILALSSVPIISYYLAQELEQEGIEVIQAQPAPPAGTRRVIVLLGQNTTRTQLRPLQGVPPENPPLQERALTADQFQILSRLPTQLTEHGDRLLYAGQLYQQEAAAGTNPLIIISAGSRIDRRRKEGETREAVSEAADIRSFLAGSYGVPESAMVIDTDSFTIRRSAENVKRILENPDNPISFGGQILLVGSALNMHRAYLTFRQVFAPAVTIYARPTDFYTLPAASRLSRVAQGRDLIEREVQASDFVPTAEAFYIGSQALTEYLSSIYYFLRGWLRPF